MDSSIFITTLVGGLIGIVGFFAAYFFRRTMQSIDKLDDSVSDLQSGISGMNAIILAEKINLRDLKTDVAEHKGQVWLKLNEHDDKINEHSICIAELKAK